MENQNAIVKIQNAKVIRHVGASGAFAIEETVTLPNGNTFGRSWTVWQIDAPAPHLQANVTVTGLFSAKKREYEMQGETRIAIDLNINEPKIVVNDDEAIPF